MQPPATRSVFSALPRLAAAICLAASALAVPAHASPPGVQLEPLEGYAVPRSVSAGETVGFHVSSLVGDYRLEIYRDGNFKTLMHTSPLLHGAAQPIPAEAWEKGAGWAVSYEIAIPSDWASGAYLARLRPASGPDDEHYLLFVVRPSRHGSHARVLMVLSTPTFQAYNLWGGKSIYESDVPGDPERSVRVSFERPYDDRNGTGLYLYKAKDLVRFLDKAGFQTDFVDPLDLERDPTLADAYEVIVTADQDEYVSPRMLDVYESFRNRGGSLGFFGACNTYWAIRYEGDGSQLVTYKSSCKNDPEYKLDPTKATCLWGSPELGRPPERLAGVNYVPLSWRTLTSPCRVEDAGHWALAGTGVLKGDLIGRTTCGGETAATSSASPARVDVVLRTQLPDRYGSSITYPAEAVYFELTPDYGFADGRGGRVFSAGSTSFPDAILQDARVDTLMRNVVQRLLGQHPDPGLDGLADADGDLVADLSDNCTAVSNRDQTDTDRDSVGDACDSCVGIYNPRMGTLGLRAARPGERLTGRQLDADGDGFGNACDADLTNDGIVNFADLTRLKATFFSPDPLADLNGDGLVNFIDRAIMKKAFFTKPGPSGLACAGTILCSTPVH